MLTERRSLQVFSEESIRFMEKVGKLSGISEITSIPERESKS